MLQRAAVGGQGAVVYGFTDSAAAVMVAVSGKAATGSAVSYKARAARAACEGLQGMTRLSF